MLPVQIVLINPGHAGIRPEDEEEHLGLAYLAACAREQGHEVRIIDGTLIGTAPARLARLALDPVPDFIGISVAFQEIIPAAAALIAELRRLGFTGHLSIGGHPPTFLHRELRRDYRGFDSVVVGEGEKTFLDLLAALDVGRDWRSLPGLVAVDAVGIAERPRAEGSPLTPGPELPDPTPRPLIEDLDALPHPARDSLQGFLARSPGPRLGSVLRSRGCYGNCSFCDTRAFYAASPGPAWRVRSAANVVDEVEKLVRDDGVECIRFWDDNFMGPGRRGREAAEDLAREFIRRGLRVPFSLECRVTDVDPDLFRLLKEAGLYKLFLGIESINPRQLEFYAKKVTAEDNRRALAILDQLGLDVIIGMIMFDPDTTMDELNANLDFLKEVFGSWAVAKQKVARAWNRLEVYAGTPVERTLREQGRLKGSYLRYDYDFTDPAVGSLYRSGAALRRIGLPVRDALRRLRRRRPRTLTNR